MKRYLLLLLLFVTGFLHYAVAQVPSLPVKETLSLTIFGEKIFTNSSSPDTVKRVFSFPQRYTLEVAAKVNSAEGRGLDIEARNASAQGFRLSLNTSSLHWTSTLSAPAAVSGSGANQTQIIRAVVDKNVVHIFHNGAFIQTYPLSVINEIIGNSESSTPGTMGTNMIPGWAGIAPNNTGRPSDYGWSYNGTTVTNLFNTANSSSGVRYLDVNATGNIFTYNGTTYFGRIMLIRWDSEATRNTCYSYPVTLEANTTYDFSMLHAYNSNATGSRTMTVGVGKTNVPSGRIANRIFTTSGTRVLNRNNFVFTSQEAGQYYLTVTGDWALFAISDLSLNKVNIEPRITVGKNYTTGNVDMEISSVTYDEGVFAPGSIVTGPMQTVMVTGDQFYANPSFNTNFIVNGKTDFHLTGENTPLINSTVQLNHPGAWLYFDNIRPSDVRANWLQHVSINGAPANSSEHRLAIYKSGTVVIPFGNQTAAHALETFSEPNLGGATKVFQSEMYHRDLGDFNNTIRSFKLHRGFMATLASGSDGSGFSQVFIADKEDLIINQMPAGIDGTASFIRVFKWDWESKKGWAGGGLPVNLTRSTWFYDWNVGGIPTENYNYAIIRHNQYWPGWNEINNKQNVNHLLGFNEPDRPDQANMSVEEAIRQWPEMMKSGLRIGSPSPSNHFNSWLPTFMDKCEELNYRVDYIAIHAYWGAMSPQNWYSWLKGIHDRYKRPIWITEWNNGANWTTESWPTDPAAQFAKQYNEIKGILTVLDTTSFIERYSIYNWVENKRAMVLADTLTPAGKYYAANKSNLAYRPEGAYTHRWKLVSPALDSLIDPTNYFKVTIGWRDLNGEMGAGYVLERKIEGRGSDYAALAEFNDYVYGSRMVFTDSLYGSASYRLKSVGKDMSVVYSPTLTIIRDNFPLPPEQLTGEVLSTTKTKLQWSRPAVRARSYNLKRSLSADGPFEIILPRTNLLEYLDEALAEATDYYYVVTSLNSAGESENSTILHLRTKDLAAPEVVQSPRIASGDANVTLTWDFSYDARYEILRSETSGGTYEVIATDIDDTRFEDTQKINGNSYFYKIVAFNAAGRSPETSELVAVPTLGQHLRISFDENEGILAADSWGGNHGSLKNGTTWTYGHDNLPGAVKLQQTSADYVQLPAGIVSTLHDFTIATWIKLPANQGNNTRVFDFGSGTGTYMILVPRNGTSMRYKITCPAGTYDRSIPYVLPLGEWVHVAISQSGSSFKLYVNGALQYEDANASVVPADMGITTQNYLGRSQWPNDPYCDHTYDDFRIYNYGLSAGDINELAAKLQDQKITFASLNEKETNFAAFDPGASATSGLPVTYESSNTQVAVIENGLITFVGPGVTHITARQSGDSTYYHAIPVTQRLIVGNGLINHYRFEQNLNDDISYQNGVAFGGPGYQAGLFEKALSLDGVDAYGKLPDNISSLQKITIATWIYWKGGSNWQRIVDFGNNTTNYMFLTPRSGGNTLRLGIRTPSGGEQFVDAPTIALNTWVHVSATISNNTAKLYVDGTLVGTKTSFTLTPASLGSTINNLLGRSQFTADPFLNAMLDEFRIYNYELTAEEIQQLARRPQSISFAPIEPRKINDAPVELIASASSGLPVRFTSSDTTVATVINNVVYVKAHAGETTITATQEGNEQFLSAAPVSRVLFVNKLFYQDNDHDGFGSTVEAWLPNEEAPAGFATNNLDCDDSKVLYTDQDGDGLGAGEPSSCGVDNNSDCNDSNPIQLTVVIPSAYALSSGVDANTIYHGFSPASTLKLKPVVAGGTAPYTYQWNGGQQSKTLVVSTPGVYGVTITDSKGCKIYAAVTIQLVDVACGYRNSKVLVYHPALRQDICINGLVAAILLKLGWKLGEYERPMDSARSTETISAEEEQEETITLFPNPVHDELHVLVTDDGKKRQITLRNSQGVIVYKGITTGSEHIVPVSTLAAGLYYLDIKDGIEHIVKKVIKD